MKKHSILTSILIIVMWLSMTVGGTYAMFATESKVNVAITLGKVDVEAYLKKEPTLSSTLGSNLSQTTAEYNEEKNAIEVNNMVPGDQVNFTISVVNKSTVSVKYQEFVIIQGDVGVGDKFIVEAMNKTLEGIAEHKSPTWTTIEPSTDKETPFMEVPVTVTFPADPDVMIFDGEEQGKSIAITFGVRAVQANAYTGPDAIITKYEEADLPVRNPIKGNMGGITFPDAPDEITVESAWTFETTDTPDTVIDSPYKGWICDFLIECNGDVALGELGLWGAYGGMDFAFANPIALPEGQSLFMLTSVGMPLTYEDICTGVVKFDCGVFRGLVTPQMKGKKITVSLCLINPVAAEQLINDVASMPGNENKPQEELILEVMKKDNWIKYANTGDVLFANQTSYTFE